MPSIARKENHSLQQVSDPRARDLLRVNVTIAFLLTGSRGVSFSAMIGGDQARQLAHSRGERDYEFWRAHGGVSLVWSNPDASDEVMILNALLRPRFHLLLDIAIRFGFYRLAAAWTRLRFEIMESGWPEERVDLIRAEPVVERCLRHMREGMDRR